MAKKGTGMFSNRPQTPLPNSGMIKALTPSVTKAPAPSLTKFQPGQYIGNPPKSTSLKPQKIEIPMQREPKNDKGFTPKSTQKMITTNTRLVNDRGARATSKGLPMKKGK